MSEHVAEPISCLDAESWRILNRAVSELESSWRNHSSNLASTESSNQHRDREETLKPNSLGGPKNRPELGNFVPEDSSPMRTAILVQLIKVDQEMSWGTGERRLLESYLTDWPEIASNTLIVTELLAAECLNRAVFNACPNASELHERFPEVADHIDVQAISDQAKEDSRSASCRAGDLEKGQSVEAARTQQRTGMESAKNLPPGSRFGRYEVRDRIGHGSMGAVYRAWDTRLQREVALKIPHFGQSADRELIAQFRREAVAMAQVHHAAVCPVFDAFEVDGTFALTMALVEGDDLGDWMAHRRLTQRQAAELTLAITRGVDAIHERGVIHGDIKLANIVMDRSGQPVLTDFGLARSTEEPHKSAESETLSGTPAYMSPERIDGSSKVGYRSDVYSLGVVLYQMLTGSLPFTGDLATVLNDVCHRPPAQPSTLRSDVNRTLEQICLKALEKRPDDRYESAQAMAHALESCANLMRLKQQRRRLRALAAFGTVLVATVAVLAFHFMRTPPPTPASDENIMLLARHRETFLIPGSDASHRAIVPMTNGKLIVNSKAQGFAPFRFFDVESRMDGKEFRFTISDEFYFEPSIPAPRNDHMCAVLSQDNRYLFCADYYTNRLIRIDLLASGKVAVIERRTLPHHWSQAIGISPDGNCLVVATGQDNMDEGGESLVVVNVEGDEFDVLAEVLLADEVVGETVGFSKDSQSAFVITRPRMSADHMLYKISLKEPFSIVAELPFPGSDLRDIAVFKRRNQIFVSDKVSQSIRVLDQENLTDTGREYSLYGNTPGSLVINEDETILYVLCPDAKKLVCLDPKTGTIIGGAQKLPADGLRIILSPDGTRLWTVHPDSRLAQFETDDLLQRIVFASNRNGAHQIFAMAPDGKEVLSLSTGSYKETTPRWSPDGRRIAFISNRAGPNHICIMNRAGDGVQVLPRHKSRL